MIGSIWVYSTIAYIALEAFRAWSKNKRNRKRAGTAVLLGGVAFLAFAAVAVASARHPILIVVAAPLFVFAFPWTCVRVVFVPLGMCRMSAATGGLAVFAWQGGQSGAVVAEAWALCNHRSPSADVASLIRADIEAWRHRGDEIRSYDAGHIIAIALLTSIESRTAARPLFWSVLDFDHTRRGLAHAMATEWLAADACERGDWRTVKRLDARPGQATRTLRLLGSIANCVDGRGYRGGLGLRLRWLVAPRRRHTRSFVRRVMARRPEPIPSVAPADPEFVDDGLSSISGAVHNLIVLLAVPGSVVNAEHVDWVGWDWDDALDSQEFEEHLLRRAAALRVANPDAVTEAVRGDVSAALEIVVRRSRGGVDREELTSTTAYNAAFDQSAGIIDELEDRVEHLATLVDEWTRPLMEIWAEWCAVRAAYESAASAGGEAARHSLFEALYAPLCNLAVEMSRTWATGELANAIFRWLLEEATECDDEGAISLFSGNVAAW